MMAGPGMPRQSQAPSSPVFVSMAPQHYPPPPQQQYQHSQLARGPSLPRGATAPAPHMDAHFRQPMYRPQYLPQSNTQMLMQPPPVPYVVMPGPYATPMQQQQQQQAYGYGYPNQMVGYQSYDRQPYAAAAPGTAYPMRGHGGSVGVSGGRGGGGSFRGGRGGGLPISVHPPDPTQPQP